MTELTEDQIKKIDERINKKIDKKISELQVDRAISFNFNYFERKFDGINQKFTKLEENMNFRFDKLEKMIVNLEKS